MSLFFFPIYRLTKGSAEWRHHFWATKTCQWSYKMVIVTRVSISRLFCVSRKWEMISLRALWHHWSVINELLTLREFKDTNTITMNNDKCVLDKINCVKMNVNSFGIWREREMPFYRHILCTVPFERAVAFNVLLNPIDWFNYNAIVQIDEYRGCRYWIFRFDFTIVSYFVPSRKKNHSQVVCGSVW